MRTGKGKYFNKLLNPVLSTRILWRNIRDLNICPKNKSNCDLDPDLNDYFLSNCSLPHKNNASASLIDSNSNNENNIGLSFSHITSLDIEKSVYKFKSNAVRCDNKLR